MELCHQKLNRTARTTVGMLLLAWVILLLLVGRMAVGESFARYMTTGTADVGFEAQAKPSVTVLQPITDDEQAEVTFQVICSESTEHTGVRIRVYGYGEDPEATTVTATHTTTGETYVLSVRALDSQTPAGAETGAPWVYVFTDNQGEELLFDMNGEALSFVLRTTPTTAEVVSAEASSLRISAEAVRK